MGFRSVLSMAQQWAAERIQPGDSAIDATIGNGVDTLMLCRAVGPTGTVHGFDVQPRALAETQARIEAQCTARIARPVLHLRSHAEMLEALPPDSRGRVSAVMFNLGYLPGGSEDAEEGAGPIITRPDTTLPALDAALTLLKPDGVLTIVLYSGHTGGEEEAEAVRSWAQRLPQLSYQVLMYQFLNAKAEAPYLIGVLKKKPPAQADKERTRR